MRRTLLSRLRNEDDGLGLVLVLGMGGILTGLMILSTTSAIRSLSSSREHVSFESALAVADGGVDLGLARAQQVYAALGTDSHLVPAPTNAVVDCRDSVVSWPWAAGVQPTAAQERTWARTELVRIADTVPGCLRTAKNGQYAILKPFGRQVVYSLGWSPSRAAAEQKVRLIKAEYLFTPYSPSHAVLTGGNLELDSSTLVTTAPPNDPLLAAVHTNGSISVSSGNPTVTGLVTQSGSGTPASSNNFTANPGNSVAGAAKQRIPFAGSRAIWGKNRLTNPPGGWYDLCPDGRATLPTGAEPCDAGSTLLANVAGGGEFRGWSFTPSSSPGYPASGSVPRWHAGSDLKVGGYSGTYYVHQGDVDNPASNTGPRVPNLTVLASAVSMTCNKKGGNIRWGSTDPAAPSIVNTWLVADQDLMTESNYQAGSDIAGTVISGLFIAGDQIEMSTSSNGAYGAVVALDQCDPSGSLAADNIIKNPQIYYDPNAQAPFTDIINNTLWLEY